MRLPSPARKQMLNSFTPTSGLAGSWGRATSMTLTVGLITERHRVLQQDFPLTGAYQRAWLMNSFLPEDHWVHHLHTTPANQRPAPSQAGPHVKAILYMTSVNKSQDFKADIFRLMIQLFNSAIIKAFYYNPFKRKHQSLYLMKSHFAELPYTRLLTSNIKSPAQNRGFEQHLNFIIKFLQLCFFVLLWHIYVRSFFKLWRLFFIP